MNVGESAGNEMSAFLNKKFSLREIIGTISAIVDLINKIKQQPAKVKFGEFDRKHIAHLMKKGVPIHTIKVDRTQLENLQKNAEKTNAGYMVVKDDDSNLATLLVPENQLSQLNTALKITVDEMMRNNSVIVKNDNLIDDKKMNTLNKVLQKNDIPAYSFKTDNNKYVNIVPKEFDGRYEKATVEANLLDEKVDNIEIKRFEQTSSLKDINYIAEKTNLPEARFLQQNNPKIKISKMDDESYIAIYPKKISDEVAKLKESFKDERGDIDDILINVVDKNITLNKRALLKNENEKFYFMRVPNTGGEDYIRINKDESVQLDGGQTVQTKLDFKKNYEIFNERGVLTGNRNGEKLAESFNTRSKLGNKDTESFHYFNDNIERVEFYNAKENRLISVGMENADMMTAALMEQGKYPLR